MSDFSRRLEELVGRGEELAKQADSEASRFEESTGLMKAAMIQVNGELQEKLGKIGGRVDSDGVRRYQDVLQSHLRIHIPEKALTGRSHTSPRNMMFDVLISGRPLENTLVISGSMLGAEAIGEKIETDFSNISLHLEKKAIEVIEFAFSFYGRKVVE